MTTKAQPYTWDYGKRCVRKLGIVWKLERLVNYGVKAGKINAKEFKKNLPKLKIDPDKKAYLEKILK